MTVCVLNWHRYVTTARVMAIGFPTMQIGLIATCVGREAMVHMYAVIGLMYLSIVCPPHQFGLLYGSCVVLVLEVVGVEDWFLFRGPLLPLATEYVSFLRIAQHPRRSPALCSAQSIIQTYRTIYPESYELISR